MQNSELRTSADLRGPEWQTPAGMFADLRFPTSPRSGLRAAPERRPGRPRRGAPESRPPSRPHIADPEIVPQSRPASPDCEVVLKPASQAPAAGSDRRPPKKPQSQKGIVRQGPLYKSTAPKVFVNDAPVDARSTVKSGDVLRFGHAHEFRMRPTSTQGTDGEDSGRRDPEGRVVRRPWEELQRCVDEANLITEELRSGSDGEAARRLVFKLHTSPHLRPDEERESPSRSGVSLAPGMFRRLDAPTAPQAAHQRRSSGERSACERR